MASQKHPNKVLLALAFASEKHRFQLRKGKENTPFIHHPIQVVDLLSREGDVEDADTLCAAFLHDTLEDTDATAQEIADLFGQKVLAIVQEVTDAKKLMSKERKQCQIDEAPRLSTEAKLVRLADKVMNVYDIGFYPPNHWTIQRRTDYINWCEKVVNGLRGTNLHLETIFDNRCRQSREQIALDED